MGINVSAYYRGCGGDRRQGIKPLSQLYLAVVTIRDSAIHRVDIAYMSFNIYWLLPPVVYLQWLSSCLEQSLLLQVLRDDGNGLFNTRLLGVDVNLCILWSLVWSTDASKLLDLACSRLLVQALGVSLLSFLHWDINEDLDEREGGLVVGGVGVQLSGELTVGFVW